MKKIILLTLAALLLGAILFFYVSFNGNFISKMIAKNKVEAYLEEHYKDQNRQLTDSGYNFKDGQYVFHYEIYNNANRYSYTFSIGGPVFPNGRIFSYLNPHSEDEVLSEQFSKEGGQWLEQKLRAQNIAFDNVVYSVSVPKKIFENVSWKPDVDAILTPWITVEVTDEQQTEEQFMEQAEQIRQMLNEYNVTYDNCYITMIREFDNSDGSKEGYAETYYEGIYSTAFTPDTKDITSN